jgi:hypothetical protein
MIMFVYRLLVAAVVLACMAAAVALMMAAWLAVIAVGLLNPRLTPRRACDWTRELIRASVAHVRALDRP